ncbi:YtpR family tRNA-binding protein [Secundilactobacillus kimchicus]|uniref:tRNA-binding domain protein n=1 Tax=Secundilactobacillus kimchicus JCM 15530 TaxID=1302272 RepID=A0A0R1HUM4_9LACO|nr:DUF4479 and tRNA-binding domain-containing protein [Secundilactobacillus kimchicus]KRK49209.1 tRNA-binding domain protein [Secundilactobacillus kimchicus JCM 15530]
MLISSYNKKALGDVLIVICAPDVEQQASETRGSVTRIFDVATGETLGYNFDQVSKTLGDLSVAGQIVLTTDQVGQLNDVLSAAGFTPDLMPDTRSKFVVGYVKKMTPHPDSDHLTVTTTVVEEGKELQIVSGSPNMQAGIKVVVAEVGAMMPDGLIIWPGKLRGVESNGMISSGRELRIPNAPNRPGALILPDDYEVGQPFDFERAKTLFS